MSAKGLVFLSLVSCLSVTLSRKVSAQYWHSLGDVTPGETSITFSPDDKFVYYVSPAATLNILYREAVKGGAGTVVAEGPALTRVMRMFNKPMVVYMAKVGGDYHMFRKNEDGTGEALDLTADPAGINNIIVGMSYNGRYIYYTSNRENGKKVDVYRYDTQQNISELIFPNDKDYRVVSWSRDHTKILLEDTDHSLIFFDVNTTEKLPLNCGEQGKNFQYCLLGPQSTEIFALEQTATGVKLRSYNLGTSVGKDMRFDALSNFQISINGKYLYGNSAEGMKLEELANANTLGIDAGAKGLAISPHETLAGYILDSPTGPKLVVYDLIKRKSIELTYE